MRRATPARVQRSPNAQPGGGSGGINVGIGGGALKGPLFGPMPYFGIGKKLPLNNGSVFAGGPLRLGGALPGSGGSVFGGAVGGSGLFGIGKPGVQPGA